MIKYVSALVCTLFLMACEPSWPHVAERGEIMHHPFYDEVQFGWRWRWDVNQCVVYLKNGNKATVLCNDLEGS